MKLSLPCTLLAAVGLLTAAPLACSRAASAVAIDGYGGYGYAHGDRSLEALSREAIHLCREKSEHPDDVHVLITSRHRGSGIIVRYRADGRQRIYAYVGAASDEQAYNYATGYAEGYGGKKIEVAARWRD